MTRLDHNRALAQLSKKLGVSVTDIKKLAIWGNHSATQYPSVQHAEVNGKTVDLDQAWLESDFIPTVAKRGAAIIEARGLSSAASAASAAIDHVHTWVNGTNDGDWTSAAVVSDGSYGVPEGIISSFPVTAAAWRVQDRPGPRDRRLLPRPHRRLRRGARRGARHRPEARPHLSQYLVAKGSPSDVDGDPFRVSTRSAPASRSPAPSTVHRPDPPRSHAAPTPASTAPPR